MAGVKKVDERMKDEAGTVQSDVAALYLGGPALSKWAIPVYRNRAILLEIERLEERAEEAGGKGHS